MRGNNMPRVSTKSKKATRVKKARATYVKVKKTSKLGSGKRFGALSKSIEAEGKDPKAAAAIAASIGRKKYGASRMASMAKKGRK